jgi:hypothetical protein
MPVSPIKHVQDKDPQANHLRFVNDMFPRPQNENRNMVENSFKAFSMKTEIKKNVIIFFIHPN